jgi:ParB-like chromosome segregation protein Spo0J
MKIEKVKLEKLIPYARNSRTHSDQQVAQVAASIREFGFTNPVLIDSEDGIIAGHGRVMAARKLGLNEVPCIRLAHLTDTQKKAYIIADNKLALNSGWDEQMLGLELADLREADFDLDLVGFDSSSIEAFLNPPEHEVEIAEVTGAGKTMMESKESYDESIIRQIILIYPVEEYDAVIDAMGQYADQNGLSNNTEVVNHLLETNGYAISQRKTEES